MDKRFDRALVWFRRDLRSQDHAALYAACRNARRVWCCFVFDREILDPLPRADRRVEFIRDSLVDLDRQLRELGLAEGQPAVGLIVRHGWARDELPALADALRVQAVYANHDDEPGALARDAQVRGRLGGLGIALYTSKDHVVFERSEVMTATGTPYSVFTPYKNAWLKKLASDSAISGPAAESAPAFQPTAHPDHHPPRDPLQAWDIGRHAGALAARPAELDGPAGVPELAEIGFQPTDLAQLRLPAGSQGGETLLADFLDRIDRYADARDFPAVKGPSYLSTHLRFGTLSIRRLASAAWQRMQAGSRGAEIWLSELIWRDFYHQILHHHPRVVGHAFKPEYDALHWEHGKYADALFAAWSEGRTGYPLVDAAMLQLLRTGYMHNRLRMISASFLVKDLGIDWRRGEAWFALHLNDYDLAANNGGWQWAASTGCDAQPYFRIFNPVSQSERFDPEGKFIRRYLPQLAGLPARAIHAPWLAQPLELVAAGVALDRDYPRPVVEHDVAREATLARFAQARADAPIKSAPPRRRSS